MLTLNGGPDRGVEVNGAVQSLVTFGGYGLALLALYVAFRLSKASRSWVPLVAVGVGCAAADLLEPIYNANTNLWFYTDGQWTFYESYGISQPVWVFASYIWFIGGLAMLFYWRVTRGDSRARILRLVGVVFVVAIAFEMAAVNLALYEYWGPQALEVFGLPLWISVASAVYPTVAGIALAVLAPRLRGRRVWAAAVVPLATPPMAWFGAGLPVVALMHTEDPPRLLLNVLGIVSIALSFALIGVVSLAIPREGRATAPDGASPARPATDRPLPA